MPLFKTNANDSNHSPERTANNAHDTPERKGTLFSRRRSASSAPSGRSSDDSSLCRAGSTRSGGFFSRFSGDSGFPHNDPSIMAARQKVSEAEEAERQADRALIAARNTVKEAREHVRFLEKEAEDDARRAKAKQAEAKIVSKSARGLGRHG